MPTNGPQPFHWIMRQTWHDLLFMHWSVRAEVLRTLIPPPLEPDLFEGTAWVGVVPFWMSGIRISALPPIPTAHRFAELNVRTYARHGDEGGVWFLSLDAASRLAVKVARAWYRLPYFHARMEVSQPGTVGDGAVGVQSPSRGDRNSAVEGAATRYASRRVDRRAGPAELKMTYAPAGPVCPSQPGTLEHWLTARFRLFARTRRGGLLTARIAHDPWPLQPATARIDRCTMLDPLGLALPEGPPLLHFSKRIEVLVERPRSFTP